MFAQREHESPLLFAVRWTARLASVVCLAIIFLFFVGEGIDLAAVRPTEYVGLLFFPLGVMIGLVLAWREELAGGTIAIMSIVAFYVVYGAIMNGNLWQGWAFLPFLIPGVLFLLYGFMGRHAHHRPAQTVFK